MARLLMYNMVSLDGFFQDAEGSMQFAHNTRPDPKWKEFSEQNANGEAALIFGRKTYEMMASYWPTPAAFHNDPVFAEIMNGATKYVASRSLESPDWEHTTLLKGDMIDAIRRLKASDGPDLVILGSGEIVSQLAREHVIDEYQLVVYPVVLGSGRTLFEGVTNQLSLELTEARSFPSGLVFLRYLERP